MTPEEFEENCRFFDPNFTLLEETEDVTDSQKDWEDFWENEDEAE